jgi:hypothetical protein
MATFKLFIETDNAAFFDDTGEVDEAPELARILRLVAEDIEAAGEAPHQYQTIRDINGNDVGRYALKAGTLTAAMRGEG